MTAILRCGVLALLFSCAAARALAQAQPYLLLQGPSSGKTERIQVGQRMEWRLRGEGDFFLATVERLLPEAQAVQLGAMLVRVVDIAEVRFESTGRGAGYKRYLRIQGLVNLVAIGLALADPNVRTNQRGFVRGAAGVSAAMVLTSLTGNRKRRAIGPGTRYVLSVAGGDLRRSDDPNRPSEVSAGRPRK